MHHMTDLKLAAVSLNHLADTIHSSNEGAGWWTDKEYGDLKDHLKFVLPTKLALVHSEVSEALEGFRKGLNDDHLPTRSMLEVELADAIIRILDICGACRLDIGGALLEKYNYNQTRADHKPENREAPGGKSI